MSPAISLYRTGLLFLLISFISFSSPAASRPIPALIFSRDSSDLASSGYSNKGPSATVLKYESPRNRFRRRDLVNKQVYKSSETAPSALDDKVTKLSPVHPAIARRGFFSSFRKAFSRVGNAVKSVARKAVSSVKQVARKAVSNVRNVANKAKSAVRNVANKVKSTARNVTNRVRGAVRNVTNRVRGAVRHVANRVRGAVRRVGRVVRGAVNRVGRVAKGAVNKVGNTIKKAGRVVGAGLKKAGQFVKENGLRGVKFGLKVYSAGTGLAAHAAKFIPGVGTAVGTALQAASMGADLAADQIHVSLGSALDKGVGVLNIIKDPIGYGVDKAFDAAGAGDNDGDSFVQGGAKKVGKSLAKKAGKTAAKKALSFFFRREQLQRRQRELWMRANEARRSLGGDEIESRGMWAIDEDEMVERFEAEEDEMMTRDDNEDDELMLRTPWDDEEYEEREFFEGEDGGDDL